MTTSALKRTSILLTAQVIVSAVTLFALYKFIYHTLGAANLGLWSLVLVTTSVTRFSDLGLSGSLGRFVARCRARDDSAQAIQIIETGVISVVTILAIVATLAFPLLRIALIHVIPRDKIGIATTILPYALISIVLASLSSAVQGALDGCARLDLRAILVITSNILYVFVAALLAHFYGLIGLAWAQVLQASLLSMLGWAVLRRILPAVPLVPHSWQKATLKEMIGYATAYQVAGMSMLLYEPLTKIFLAKYGGLTDVGIFEMATRVTNQFRSLITAHQQSILPLAAEAKERGNAAIIRLYESTIPTMTALLLPALAVLVSSAPLISILWLGSFNFQFVHLLIVLALAVGLQTFIGPAYYTLLGTGKASWIAAGNLTIGASNLLYSLPLAHYYGTPGVIAGAVMALLTGSSVIIVRFHTSYIVPWKLLAPHNNSYRIALIIIALCLEATIELLYRPHSSSAALPWVGALAVAILSAILVFKAASKTNLVAQSKHQNAMAGETPESLIVVK